MLKGMKVNLSINGKLRATTAREMKKCWVYENVTFNNFIGDLTFQLSVVLCMLVL